MLLKKNYIEYQKKILKINNKLKFFNIIIIANHSNISVNNLNNLKILARKSNVFVNFYKNSLFKIGLKNTIHYNLLKDISGTLLYFLSNDIISCAKIFKNFSIEQKKIIFKSCSFFGNKLSFLDIDDISKISNKEDLLLRLTKFFKLNIYKLIYLISRIKKL